MKRLTKIGIALLFGLCVLSITAFAQDGAPPLGFDFVSIFASVFSLTGAVVAIAELVDRKWHLEDQAAQARSLAIALILGELGSGLHLGMFSDLSWQGGNAWWLVGLAVGVSCGLFGNWAFGTPIVKWILGLLHISPPEVVAARAAAVPPEVPTGPSSTMGKAAGMIAVLLILASTSLRAQDQTGPFTYFWTPRPQPVMMLTLGPPGSALANWDFKPNLTVAAMQYGSGAGGQFESTFLAAAGFGVTYEHSLQVDGQNYADYGFSADFLLRGSTLERPSIQPRVALLGSFFNNMVYIGPSYTLTKEPDGSSRLKILIAIGTTPTQN